MSLKMILNITRIVVTCLLFCCVKPDRYVNIAACVLVVALCAICYAEGKFT